MPKFIGFLIIILIYNSLSFAMEKKPYHHLPDGTFRNPEGSPKRDNNFKWSFRVFNEKKKILATYGIEQWVIDPGFGFGKTIQENFTIVKELKQLKVLGLPILLGVSRKSSIYKTLHITAAEALNGTTVVNTVGLLNGANIIRVHDVKEAIECIKITTFAKNNC